MVDSTRRSMSIVMVGGDVATAEEGKHIRKILIERGHTIRWVMDVHGEGKNRLQQAGIEFELHGESTVQRGSFDACLVLTSATASTAQVAWTDLAHSINKPVIWFEDFPGTAHVPAVKDVQPDLLLTINEAASEIAKAARPGVSTQAVGKPSFESRIQSIQNAQEKRSQTRLTLGVSPEEFLTVYWSGGEIRERVESHVGVLRDFRPTTRQSLVVPRIHPKLNRLEDKLQERLVKEACSGKAITADWHDKDVDDINVAADVIVCDAGGTEGITGPLMGIPTIVARFPDDYARLTDRGLPGGVPMTIACGAVFSAESGPQLLSMLHLFASLSQNKTTWAPVLASCRAQAKPLRSLLEPGAAGWIADALENAFVEAEATT